MVNPPPHRVNNQGPLGPTAAPRRRRRLRFSLGALLLVMLVISVAAAAASYLFGDSQGGPRPLAAMLFTLAAPALLMILVSLMREWIRRAKHK